MGGFGNDLTNPEQARVQEGWKKYQGIIGK